ncbi:PREDICTED: BRI1 kinase inhibitor 1 [Nicotiana attenuata]|uniref:Bri1 kinase inhibitor 1 n=1 Tax=Nicotiana attenuata TaxID=49451 RepID=A0A1J6HUQ8_NICAT|nr:PREDICTED: BRI1 kinase inhibitor 1 [Nicotiana attenuata]OIS96161.1 bri1 kinase inhibitor 1 [Nicotiana attenuata]
MDSQLHQNMNHKEEKQRNQESDPHNDSSSTATSPPPSSSSSPSHEFSFTISFQQTPKSPADNKINKQIPPSSSSFAIDLSPADDIFFHGHLLPLHLLSHLPISPRTSTNSMDSFTLPIKDQKVQNSKNQRVLDHEDTCDTTYTSKGKPKAKSFSLFGLPKGRKGHEAKEEKENKERSHERRKLKFDMMSQVVKRYIRMVRPLLSFSSRKNVQFHNQAYSFSGNLSSLRGKSKEINGRKEQLYSAPASMRTSPTNSGLLVTTPGAYNSSSSSSSSDSTMEELQAAIQAAIAHCKKSISMED